MAGLLFPFSEGGISMRCHSTFIPLSLCALFVLAACDEGTAPSEPAGISLTVGEIPGVPSPNTGVAEAEFFEVCKYYVGASGPDVAVNVVVDSHETGNDQDFDITLGDGECEDVWLHGGTGLDLVTVTETVPAGYSGSFVKTVVGPANTPASGSGNSASGYVDGYNGVLVEFYNELQPILVGRMTGGGSFFADNVRFTHGFELHCDPAVLPNNLEINWRGSSNAFHLTTLTSGVCTDDPAIDPLPRTAPFDTYMGTGVGTLNGVPGALISFTFTDAGEGGSADLADISIVPPGGGSPIVAVNTLHSGNQQAHPDD
jgi:hypothetical protein